MPPVILCNDFTVLQSKYSHDTWKSLNVVTKLQFETFFFCIWLASWHSFIWGLSITRKEAYDFSRGSPRWAHLFVRVHALTSYCACLFFVSAHGWHAVFTCAVSYSLLHWFTERWFNLSFSNLPVEFTSQSCIKVKNRRIFFFPLI